MRLLNPITSALLLALASAHVQAMSITEAVQSAVDYHPQVSSNRNSKLSADEDV
ncbi:MAG TPA: channel protein TolC, partial [Pseudomonas sp.]|nr:channel protein TolC [Pseudomonas sp.]